MNNAILETRNLSKTYALNRVKVRALRDISLKIERGEFAAIMGPSGCGKSTLLSLLGGLMSPTKGSIFIAGSDLSKLKERQLDRLRLEHIGFVFQSFDLLADLTAIENVEFPMVLAQIPQKEREARAKELLMRVGLKDKANHLPDELSGGQKQRVAIARALINRPEIILADEPTGNLDSHTAREIIQLLADLNLNNGITAVMVTHTPDDAAIANRIIRMHDGLIEA